jgi:hypothetical protein
MEGDSLVNLFIDEAVPDWIFAVTSKCSFLSQVSGFNQSVHQRWQNIVTVHSNGCLLTEHCKK